MRRLQVPHVDVVRVARAGAHDLSGRVDGDAAELDGRRRDERLEVAVAQQVEGADGAVERGGDERAAVRHEGEVDHGRGVLAESDKAEARGGRPELDLGVASAGGDDCAARRVGEAVDLGEEVALLLEDIRLGLPLPHQQLAELRAAKREPLAARRDGGGVDPAVRDGEGVDLVAARHLVQRKDARAEADDEQPRRRVHHCRGDPRVALVEVVALSQLPPLSEPVLAAARLARRLQLGGGGGRRLLVRVRPLPQLPDGDGTAAVDCVEGAVGRVEEDGLDCGAVPAQAGGHVPGDLVDRVDAHAQVGAARREEERVGRPAEAEDVVAVAAEGAVQREGREGALERRRGPDLHEPARGERDPFAVGREGNRRHLGLEVEVRDDDSPADVGEDEMALLVNAEQHRPVGRERNLRQVPPRLERKGEAARSHEVKALHAIADRAVEHVAGRAKDERTLPVDGAAEVAELVRETHARAGCWTRRLSANELPR
mmetsp:Transcript_48512/g.156171  ORF Transcript_48512/g.156171 Transcript_48512/m.156171 type:complete len:487 (+) Transcript_48512:1399-2859(+)